MPGVKKLHQESENSSKGEYILDHLFGAIGILAGDASKMVLLALVHEPARRCENDPGLEPITGGGAIIVSEATVTAYLRRSIFRLFAQNPYLSITQTLCSKQEMSDSDADLLAS